MKKTVKVEDIIALARKEVIYHNKYMDCGEYELARMTRNRIDSYQSIIMALAVGSSEDFNEKWEEVYKQIWDEEIKSYN